MSHSCAVHVFVVIFISLIFVSPSNNKIIFVSPTNNKNSITLCESIFKNTLYIHEWKCYYYISKTLALPLLLGTQNLKGNWTQFTAFSFENKVHEFFPHLLALADPNRLKSVTVCFMYFCTKYSQLCELTDR